MQIKILYKQGKSLRTIACEMGCSVNTRRKYLAKDSAPAFKGRVPRVQPRQLCRVRVGYARSLRRAAISQVMRQLQS
jgi:transposase